MTVNIAVGMTEIRRDGVRVGPVTKDNHAEYPFDAGDESYTPSGDYWHDGKESSYDIIAAGFPWSQLGAQVGDTVCCVWNGIKPCNERFVLNNADIECIFHNQALYVIVAHAAKPADRPRAAHKLDLHDGDVVELVGWQDGRDDQIGLKYRKSGAWIYGVDGIGGWLIEQTNPKGHRPLFCLISRAADAAQDEVIVLTGTEYQDGWGLSHNFCVGDTHRFTITFPAGSDVGTVTRERL